MDYLLKNCKLIDRNINSNIHIKDGLIIKIDDYTNGSNNEQSYENVLNLEGRLVIPGFVDSHTHLDKTLIGTKVVNKSGTLEEAIQLMTEYKKNMSEEEVTERAKEAIDKYIQNGTRYVRTHVDIDDEIKLTSLKALISLKKEYKDLIEIQIVAFPQQGINGENKNYYYMEEALKEGADLIGGIPALEQNPREHVKRIFNLAVKYDKDIDMHIDETDEKSVLTIKDLLDFTKQYNYFGRVSAGHLCSLANYTKQELEPLIDEILAADLNVISLPSTNLYLQGRNDERNVRRGIAPIKYFNEKNVPIMIGSDNNQDPFNPFGNFKMLEEALIAAHGTHMGGEAELEALFDMITAIPGKKLNFNYSIKENDVASFVVLDVTTKSQSIIQQSDIYGQFIKGEFLVRS